MRGLLLHKMEFIYETNQDSKRLATVDQINDDYYAQGEGRRVCELL